MKSSLFQAQGQSYQVSQIVYASGVEEIPQDRRKGDATHSFKIVTTVNASRCYFRSPETARNAHNALAAMMRSANPNVFPHGDEILDMSRIVSIGEVIAFRQPRNDMTHAIIVNVATADERNAKVWLRYHSEDKAQKGRFVLQRKVNEAAQGGAPAAEQPEPKESAVAAETVAVGAGRGEGVPF